LLSGGCRRSRGGSDTRPTAARDNPGLAAGVNVRAGKVTNAAVAATFGLELPA
jgi:alanine dehydrogenase